MSTWWDRLHAWARRRDWLREAIGDALVLVLGLIAWGAAWWVGWAAAVEVMPVVILALAAVNILDLLGHLAFRRKAQR